jgi:hypothetical protein
MTYSKGSAHSKVVEMIMKLKKTGAVEAKPNLIAATGS